MARASAVNHLNQVGDDLDPAPRGCRGRRNSNGQPPEPLWLWRRIHRHQCARCYGNYCEVYSRHGDDLDAAIKAARKHKGRAIVSTDGGWPDNHQPGSMIHRQFAGNYETVWSLRQESEARAADRDYEEHAARTWGRGSDAYNEAMADDHARRNFREGKPHWAD